METLSVDRLQSLVIEMGQRVTVPQVSEATIGEALSALDASAGTLSLLTDDGALFVNVESVGYAPQSAEQWPFFPAEGRSPIADAVRLKRPVLLETWEERCARYPDLTVAPAVGGQGALVAVPIVHPLRTKSLGGLAIAFSRDRGLDEREWTFLLALTDLCAQALDRVALGKEVRRSAYRREAAEESLARSREQFHGLQKDFDAAMAQHRALIAHADALTRKVQEMMGQKHAFMRDVLSSVTEGRLRLCAAPSELPSALSAFNGPIALSAQGGLRELRHLARKASEAAGLSAERGNDLETAVGEAALNAVVHGQNGVGAIGISRHGQVQVRVVDQGTGIAEAHLPFSTLARGWSTKDSFGHGFPMMLQTARHVYLLTGETGTTVVLEQDRNEPVA